MKDKCGHEVGLFARCQRPEGHEGEHSVTYVPSWITFQHEGDEPVRLKYATHTD